MVMPPQKTGMAWLLLYITTNLAVTMCNKALFVNFNWEYPSTLSLWHYVVTATGAIFITRVMGAISPARLDMTTHLKLMLYSVLFNVNILLSNVTLNMVSMSMHQVVRALVPACTVCLSFVILGKRYSPKILLALAVIFCGVLIYAAKGEVSYTMMGLALTFAGAVLAALKGILTNIFMVGKLKLHVLDLLVYTSTYSGIQLCAVLWYRGQLQESIESMNANPDSDQLRRMLLLNGIGAFCLNVFSFNANKATSPLAMNIGGTAKQVLAILLGIIIFGTPVNSMTVAGVLVTVTGIIMYAKESYAQRMAAQESIAPKAIP